MPFFPLPSVRVRFSASMQITTDFERANELRHEAEALGCGTRGRRQKAQARRNLYWKSEDSRKDLIYCCHKGRVSGKVLF